MASSASEDERPVKQHKEKKAKKDKKRPREETSGDERTPVKKERKEKKHKEDKKRSRKDSGSSSDEGVVDRNPVKKEGTKANIVKNSNGDEMIEIGSMRYVTVSSFKGKTLVDIREYYRDKASGEMKPGKKGISLSRDQFDKIKSLMPEIEAKMR